MVVLRVFWLKVGACLLFWGAASPVDAFETAFLERVQSADSQGWNDWMDFSERFGGVILPSLGIFPYLAASLNPEIEEGSAEIAIWRDASEALVFSSMSVWALKASIGRARPYVASGAAEFSPFTFNSDYHAFPSGHTSSAFSVATVLSHYSDSWVGPIFFYSIASMTAYSRMYQNKHWLTDVIAGAALGWLSGQWALKNASGFLSMEVALLPTAQGFSLVGRF